MVTKKLENRIDAHKNVAVCVSFHLLNLATLQAKPQTWRSEQECKIQTLSDPGRSIRAAFRTLLRDMIDPYPKSAHAHPEILIDVSWIVILQNPVFLPIHSPGRECNPCQF